MNTNDTSALERTDIGSDAQHDGTDNRQNQPRTIHESPPCGTITYPGIGDRLLRWTLRVDAAGNVTTGRTTPHDGQRYYTTADRWIPRDKNSQARLSVDEVLARHAAECAACGGDITVDELRARIEEGER